MCERVYPMATPTPRSMDLMISETRWGGVARRDMVYPYSIYARARGMVFFEASVLQCHELSPESDTYCVIWTPFLEPFLLQMSFL